MFLFDRNISERWGIYMSWMICSRCLSAQRLHSLCGQLSTRAEMDAERGERSAGGPDRGWQWNLKLPSCITCFGTCGFDWQAAAHAGWPSLWAVGIVLLYRWESTGQTWGFLHLLYAGVCARESTQTRAHTHTVVEMSLSHRIPKRFEQSSFVILWK